VLRTMFIALPRCRPADQPVGVPQQPAERATCCPRDSPDGRRDPSAAAAVANRTLSRWRRPRGTKFGQTGLSIIAHVASRTAIASKTRLSRTLPRSGWGRRSQLDREGHGLVRHRRPYLGRRKSRHQAAFHLLLSRSAHPLTPVADSINAARETGTTT
jgi:hypothetical protein